MPLISIITTTYKHEKFIADTIESVLAQTFTDWELLIGDDSPDNATWDIIQSYTVRYPDKIKAWHHSPNKGLVENMNFLIAQSNPDSKYIAFLEWDDRFRSDCLQKKYNIFQQFSKVGLVYSDMSFIDENGKVTLKSLFNAKKVPFYQDRIIPIEEYIWARNPLIVSYSSVAIRKDILNSFSPIDNPSQSKTYAVSDYDLFCRIASVHHVYGINKPLTEYRRHAGNLSSSYTGLFKDLKDLIESYYKKGIISEKIYQEKISWIGILMSISYLSFWDKKKAYHEWKNSIHSSLLYGMIYKIGIFGFLLIPSSLGTKIIKSLIRRGE